MRTKPSNRPPHRATRRRAEGHRRARILAQHVPKETFLEFLKVHGTFLFPHIRDGRSPLGPPAPGEKIP